MVGFLGEGAMGAVFLMQQGGLDRLVAVKVVKADVLTEAERRRLQQCDSHEGRGGGDGER